MNITPITNNNYLKTQTSNVLRNSNNNIRYNSYGNLNNLECDTVSFSGLQVPKTTPNKLKTFLATALLAFTGHGAINKAAAQNTPNIIKQAKACNEMLNDTSSATETLIEDYMECRPWEMKVWDPKTIKNRNDINSDKFAVYMPNYVEDNITSYSLAVEKNEQGKYDVKLIQADGNERPKTIKAYNYDEDSFVMEDDQYIRVGTYQLTGLQAICQVLGIKIPITATQSIVTPRQYPELRIFPMDGIQDINHNDASWVQARSDMFNMLPSLLNKNNLPEGIKTTKDIIELIKNAQKSYCEF